MKLWDKIKNCHEEYQISNGQIEKQSTDTKEKIAADFVKVEIRLLMIQETSQ